MSTPEFQIFPFLETFTAHTWLEKLGALDEHRLALRTDNAGAGFSEAARLQSLIGACQLSFHLGLRDECLFWSDEILGMMSSGLELNRRFMAVQFHLRIHQFFEVPSHLGSLEGIIDSFSGEWTGKLMMIVLAADRGDWDAVLSLGAPALESFDQVQGMDQATCALLRFLALAHGGFGDSERAEICWNESVARASAAGLALEAARAKVVGAHLMAAQIRWDEAEASFIQAAPVVLTYGSLSGMESLLLSWLSMSERRSDVGTAARLREVLDAVRDGRPLDGCALLPN